MVVEGGAVELVDDLDYAVKGVAVHHRHAEHAAREEAGIAREAGVMARVVARVIEADGLAVERHPAGDALAHAQPHAVDNPVAERARHAEGELAALPIVDGERRVLTPHGGGEAGEDPAHPTGATRPAA